MNKMKEQNIHNQICSYINLQYPNAYFLSDPSGIKLSKGMAVKLKKTRSKHAHLDIVMLEPQKNYKGLILEVKRSRDKIYRKDGLMRNDEHILDQIRSINHLRSKGYKVEFVWSLDMAIELLKEYFETSH
jgi:hypothetical protein